MITRQKSVDRFVDRSGSAGAAVQLPHAWKDKITYFSWITLYEPDKYPNIRLNSQEMKLLEQMMKISNVENHCKRVMALSLKIGNHMGIEIEMAKTLVTAASFHDVGKLVILQSVLFGNKELSEKEHLINHMHPEYGRRMMHLISPKGTEVCAAGEIISQHHEKMDGSGYPRGLRGRDIGLPARIIAVADEFDGLTKPKPYQQKALMSPEAAAKQIAANAGKEFDPQVVRHFLEIMVEERMV